jgi:RNA polymerase sigma factor (sigma-70 family)
LRDAAGAADVAQEAFLRAFRSLERFSQDAAFRPWLLRIVSNLALNEQRSRSRRLGLLARVGRRPAYSRQDSAPAGRDRRGQ